MRTHASRQGFTLIELTFYGLLFSVLGLMVYSIMNVGTRLYATNVATNHTHHATRIAINRMQRDIHAAVSAPRLVNASAQDVTPVVAGGIVAPEAGIRFQLYAGGPVRIGGDVAAGSTLIPLNVTSTAGALAVPKASWRLVVPRYQIEGRISSVSGAGANWNATLSAGTTKAIENVGSNVIVAHYTRQVAYIVQGGELRYFDNLIGAPTSYTVIASAITTATPFSFPVAANGQADTSRVEVLLAALDEAYSNRTSTRTRSLLSATIPYRYKVSNQ